MRNLLEELQIDRHGTAVPRPAVPGRSHHGRTRKALLVTTGLAAIVATTSAYWAASRPVVVTVSPVTSAAPAQPAVLLTAGGYVRDARVVYVAPKVAGRLVALLVREGDHVPVGGVIAEIDTRDLAQDVAEARANYDVTAANLRKLEAGSRAEEVAERRAQVEALNLSQEQAERDLARARSLFTEGLITAQALDQVETAARAGSRTMEAARQGLRLVEAGPRIEEIDTARAAVQAARARLTTSVNRLEYGRVVSPVAGRVLRKFRNVGDFVSPDVAFIEGYETVAVGSPIVSLAAAGQQEAAADINETDVAKIAVGRPVELVPNAYPDELLRGTVSQIAPRADRNKNTVEVKVAIDRTARTLPYDLGVKVTFLDDTKAVNARSPVTVPTQAIRQDASGPHVYVVVHGSAKRRPVTLGSQSGANVAVVAGLAGGDQVILEPKDGVTDGTPVRLR